MVPIHDCSNIHKKDIHQIDHPYLDTESNGLTYLISRMKGQDIYSHITLEKGERSELADIGTELL